MTRTARRNTLATGLALLVASPAWAYRTIDDYADVPDGARVSWPGGAFQYRVHEDVDDALDATTVGETSQYAFQVWAGAQCAALTPQYLGPTEAPATPGDGENTIELVESDWARLGYPDDATGATDLLFQDQGDGTWTIVEADIYINAEHHRFTLADPPGDLERSLVGVLVHEGGHALGLLHPCELEGDDGAPVCDEDALPEAIMSPYYDAAQLFPEEDDVAGLCYLYPSPCPGGCEPGYSCRDGACVSDFEGTGGQSGSECDGTFDPSTGECKEPPRRNGMRCTESNQCLGGQCLGGIERGPICTQRCGTGLPACPNGWGCGKVEDRNVCVPPSDDTGCSVAPRERPVSSPLAPLGALGAAALVALFHRRRRRSRTLKEAE
jgi:MYXO-CTERM domain-containing protein